PNTVIDMVKLGEMIHIKEEDLLSLSFYFVIKTFRSNEDVERSRFISGMIRDHLCYCYECLQEKLYYQIFWKIKDLNVCIKHNVLLADKCGTCNKLIKWENLTDINLCPGCGYSLSTTLTNRRKLNVLSN